MSAIVATAPPGGAPVTPSLPGSRLLLQGARVMAWPALVTAVFFSFLLVPRIGSHPVLRTTFAGVGGFLVLWQAILAWTVHRRGRALRLEFLPRPSHWVQALLQGSIYVAFAWYWRPLVDQLPLIAAQIVFLYGFDSLLSWSRRDVWRLGFGPLPILLGTNLFIWFRDDWFPFQFLLVATGALGKEFLVWTRDGRRTHIFNPSALGLSLFSLVLLATGTTSHTWGEQLATQLNLPPAIYLHVFLAGLVVQSLFGVTLMTFAAAAFLFAANLVYTRVTGVYFFVDSNIPIAVFLGLHLLMTDPATTPRTPLGKVIFGAGYGLSAFVLYDVLRDYGAPRFYDKLLGVPLLNLCVPWIDRFARTPLALRWTRWEAAFTPRRLNLLHMTGWIALFGVMLATGFVQRPHPGREVTFWEQACQEHRPHACDNLVAMLSTHCGEGSGAACNHLATLHVEGRLVPTNAPAAAALFARACELGDFDGCVNTALQYVFQGSATSHEAARNAVATLARAAAATTNAAAVYVAAAALESGHGIDPDPAQARALYARACDLGEPRACKPAARMEFHGQGGRPDPTRAAQSLARACNAGDAESCTQLARMFHDGIGVPADEASARALLTRACELGDAAACQLARTLAPLPASFRR